MTRPKKVPAAKARRFSTKDAAPKEAVPEDRPLEPEVLLGSSGGGATKAGWHAIEAFLRCPKEYQLKHVRGLYQPRESTPDHFAVGGLFHAGRARWFASKFDTSHATWELVRTAIQHEAQINKLPVSIGAEQKALILMEAYVEFWSVRPKPRPVACEYLLGPSPLLKGEHSEAFKRTARLDDVSYYPEAGGRLCIGEAKTTSTSVADTASEYDLHGQPLMQLALWVTSENGEAQHGPVAGFVLDVAVKGYGEKKPSFGRIVVPIPAFALQWYVHSMLHYVRQSKQVEWDTEVPRNTSQCTRLKGRGRVPCDFRELCKHGRSAALNYVMEGGKQLTAHVPEEGRRRMPWE